MWAGGRVQSAPLTASQRAASLRRDSRPACTPCPWLPCRTGRRALWSPGRPPACWLAERPSLPLQGHRPLPGIAAQQFELSSRRVSDSLQSQETFLPFRFIHVRTLSGPAPSSHCNPLHLFSHCNPLPFICPDARRQPRCAASWRQATSHSSLILFLFVITFNSQGAKVASSKTKRMSCNLADSRRRQQRSCSVSEQASMGCQQPTPAHPACGKVAQHNTRSLHNTWAACRAACN